MFNYRYTFIIPHHNNPNLLNRCIQTIPERNDIEIIVVDDNSEEKYKPQNLRSDVKLISIDKRNSKGAGRARNYGLCSAQGEWLLFADCDDFYEHGFIEELDKYSAMESLDLLFFDVYYAYDIEHNQCRWKTNYSLYLRKCIESKYDDFWVRTVKHSIQTPWNFMVRHEYVNKIQAYFEEVPKGNDAYFHHYIAMNTSDIHVIDKKIYYYVWSNSGITHKIKSPNEIIQNAKHFVLIDHMREKAKACHTIRPYYVSIYPIMKQYGITLGLKVLYIRIKYGIPIYKIMWNRLKFNIRLLCG